MNIVSLLPQFIIVPSIFFILLAVAVILLVGDFILTKRNKDSWWRYDHEWAIAAGIVTILNVILVVIPWIIMSLPFNPAHYNLYSASGLVTDVATTINLEGDYVTNQYLLTLDDDPNQYVLTDPRAVQLESTDVDLSCTYEWVQFGSDRINCVIN